MLACQFSKTLNSTSLWTRAILMVRKNSLVVMFFPQIAQETILPIHTVLLSFVQKILIHIFFVLEG